MKQKKTISVLVIGVMFISLILVTISSVTYAGLPYISGWVWSENIGWISLHCLNRNWCSTSSYGVYLSGSGELSGYAWSENIGWISFNEGELSGCPGGTCKAEINTTTGEVSGWARAIAATTSPGGWDGWIHLRNDTIPNPYGVYASTVDSYSEFYGWAWGGDDTTSTAVTGWISFNCANPESGDWCATSDYKATTSVIFAGSNQPPVAAMRCYIEDCAGPGCQCDGSWITYNGGNVFYHINNISTDPDNNIATSTWSIIDYQDPYITCPPYGPPVCDMGIVPQISSGDYKIELEVIDDGGLLSATFHPLTVKQDAIAGFVCSLDNTVWRSCVGLIVAEGTEVYFNDSLSDPYEHSSFSEGASSIVKRYWLINEEIFSKGNNPNPSTTTVSGENKIELIIYDDIGRTASKGHTILTGEPVVPRWREVSP